MGPVCAVSKSRGGHQRAHPQSSEQRGKIGPITRKYAEHVLVFTTLPGEEASVEQVLEVYRLRWQVELTLSASSPSRKSDTSLSRTTEQPGVALRQAVRRLTQSAIGRVGKTISPWGYYLAKETPTPSPWREFVFAFHRVTEALAPRIGMSNALSNGNHIAAALGEPNRRRVPQLTRSKGYYSNTEIRGRFECARIPGIATQF